MKKLLFFVLFFLLSFSQVAFALSLISAPELKEAKSDSLEIVWEKVDNSMGYYVYYGKESVEGKTKEEKAYQSQLSEFIESTGATITDLEANTQYYVAITAVDENGEEGPYSKEGIFTTEKGASQTSLGLSKVDVIGENQIKLSFNGELDNSSDASREFRIIEESTKKELKLKTIDLVGTKNLLLTFDENLNVSTKYKLTILSLLDKDGKNIEQGIDGLSSFSTPSSFSAEEENLNSALPIVNISDSGKNAGENISQGDEETTLNAASETDNLPKTGPEHFVLFIFALIVGFFVYQYQKKKIENS
ncbi:fibronectin type III domain-containing protein [Candidatus Gracilibacteria bacterium]|nr:fibronectin type III domain-containing protein [Candidatus Gracilibacteria bacterium]NUJ98963.1 fibronectin type III domain-containing protein [Candidatus Gracilibacteria bacterium]